jgi:hypothetical protein
VDHRPKPANLIKVHLQIKLDWLDVNLTELRCSPGVACSKRVQSIRIRRAVCRQVRCVDRPNIRALASERADPALLNLLL